MDTTSSADRPVGLHEGVRPPQASAIAPVRRSPEHKDRKHLFEALCRKRGLVFPNSHEQGGDQLPEGDLSVSRPDRSWLETFIRA